MRCIDLFLPSLLSTLSRNSQPTSNNRLLLLTHSAHFQSGFLSLPMHNSRHHSECHFAALCSHGEIKVYIDLTLQTNGSTCDLHNNDTAETPGTRVRD